MTVVKDANGTVVTTTSNAVGQPLTVVAKLATRSLPGHPGFALVGGDQRHTYTYDPLGRLVKATTDRGSEVILEYDGLDRVFREHQTYAGQRQTTERTYADDFSWSETVYPTLADGTRVRHVADRIGRIERVEADGRIVATYTYSGLDRLAARRAGPLVQTRFQYDDRERLTLMQVARRDAGAGPLGRVVWAQRAAYGTRGADELTDTRFGDGSGPDVVLRTAFSRDGFGRATLTTTSVSAVVGAGGATADETSATAMRYDGSRLVESMAFDGVAGGKARALRVDTLEYDDKADRVRHTVTQGGFDAKVAVPTAIGMPTAMASAEVAAKGEQTFAYDANGNLVADGRYLYAYDFRNRLVLVQDTWAPWGYHESVRFDYDAVDRRIAIHRLRDVEPKQQLVSWAPPWIGGMTWLVYDGDRVIVEAIRNHPKAGPLPRFVARYIHGGRPGELLAFDRRPEADPNEDTRRFYVHEDLNGSIREASDADGRLHPVRQMDALAGRPLGERSPGEAVMVGRTGVRLPYIGGAARVDGFAAMIYRDDVARHSHDYRRAPNYHKAADRGLFAESISSAQTTGLVALGAVTAAAFAPTIVGAVAPYLGTIGSFAARQTALGYGVSALSGGSISFGVYGGTALLAGSPFDANEAAAAFASGALFGMAGGFVNGLGFGLVKSLAADVGVSFAVGTMLSLATGDPLATATNDGAAGALMDGVIGFVGGAYGAAARSVASRMARQGAALAPQPPTHTAAPARRAVEPGFTDPALAETRTGALPVLEPNPPGFVLGRNSQWSGDLRILVQDMMFDLDMGSKVSQELARRIRHGQLTVRLYSGQAGDGIARAAGYWHPAEPTAVNINIDAIRRMPGGGGRFRSESAASTIVHEGIHAMGGGEVSAHVGQAIFLYRTFRREILSVPRGIDLTKGVLPAVRTTHIELLNVVRTENMHAVVNRILSIKDVYTLRNIRGWGRPVDPWIAAQGGWGRALNINDPIYDAMERNWRDWIPWANDAEGAFGYRMGMW
ncbi:MAG: RHS repeat protein [Burkholderiales bacterium]|nr:RHS repeat protein [Burkholderiales bacterium]